MTGIDQGIGQFAGLLRDLRIRAGWTQEELAEAAGVSVRTVSGLERGAIQRPQRETVELLADALGLDRDVRIAFAGIARGHVLDLPVASTQVPGGLSAATRTLPRDVRSFTGRESELMQLMNAAQDIARPGSTVAIVAIGGMAGVGKTALAVHAAHRLADQFPDGQIFLTLNGHTPGLHPVDSSDALESLLLLTDTHKIPVGVEPRAALWRKRLAGKRVLLVLDDAASSDQVRPLLPGTPGCLVLVTSRLRLKALQDVAVLGLDILPPAQARGMLIRLAGRADLNLDDGAVADITRLCGYLPLAIGLTAAQLRHDPLLTPARLAARLTDAQHRPELIRAENLSVSTAFDMSYRDLEPAQQRLFRRLALQPGTDTDVYAAAALDDSGTAAAQRNLDILYDHYLIAQPAPGRYSFHDLIREHAQALASADPAAERDDALTRLLDYYLSTARAADRHLARRTATGVPDAITVPPVHAPELQSRDEALAWMDAQSVNLRAAVSFAATHGQTAHAIAIPAAMTGYLLARSRWTEGITVHLIALTAADEAGNRAASANALSDLGRLRLMTGDLAAARNLTQAAAIQRGLGNRVGEANALAALGGLQHSTGEFKSATRNLNRALRLYRDCADLAGEARTRYDLGVVQYNTGHYPAAVTSFRAALRMFRHYPDRLGQADAISYLAAIDRETGQYISAAANMTTALGIYRDLGDRHEEAGALMFLGAMQYPTGNYQEALRNLTAALETFRDLREPFGEAAVLNELGIVYRETGDLAAATDSLNRALGLFRDLSSRIGEAEVLGNLGRVHCQAGDYASAATSLERALELHRELTNPNGETSTLSSLGELMLASGTGEACPYFEQALDIAVRLSLLPEEARAREGIGNCRRTAGDPSAAVASSRQALEIYQRIGSPAADRVSALLESAHHHNLT